MEELVSVIITTHRRKPRILKRAIDSVYYQTYQLFEIFVINDAPDYELQSELAELCKMYDNRVQYIINDKSPGANGSRNIGIEKASGKYIAFLDDDDEWCLNKLETMLPLFSEDVSLVYGNYVNIDLNRHKQEINSFVPCQKNVFDMLLEKGNFVGGCSVPIMLKRAIIDVGCFDESFSAAQDYDLWLRLARKYRFAYTNEVVVKYYILKDAISSSPDRAVLNGQKILNKFRVDFEQNKMAKTRMVREIFYTLICGNRIKEAKEYYEINKKHMSFISFVYLFCKGCLKRLLIKLNIKSR